MKRQVITIALTSLFALPAFADVESGLDAGELQPGVTLPVPASEKTRDDVRNEFFDAQRAGNVVANAELGWSRDQVEPAYRMDSTAQSDVTREQAQVMARSANAEHGADAELSERQL